MSISHEVWIRDGVVFRVPAVMMTPIIIPRISVIIVIAYRCFFRDAGLVAFFVSFFGVAAFFFAAAIVFIRIFDYISFFSLTFVPNLGFTLKFS